MNYLESNTLHVILIFTCDFNFKLANFISWILCQFIQNSLQGCSLKANDNVTQLLFLTPIVKISLN